MNDIPPNTVLSPAPPAISLRHAHRAPCRPPGCAIGLDDFSNSSPEVLRALERLSGLPPEFRTGRRLRHRRARATSPPSASTPWCIAPHSAAVGEGRAKAARVPLPQQHRRFGRRWRAPCSATTCRRLVFASSARSTASRRRLPTGAHRAAVDHQPSAPQPADGREHPARPGAPRARLGIACCATSTRWARTRVRPDRRGRRRHAEQPDALRERRWRWAATSCACSATTTTRPTAPACARLHPRAATWPTATSPSGRCSACSARTVFVHRQPRHRPRLPSGFGKRRDLEVIRAFETASAPRPQLAADRAAPPR